MIVNDHPLSLSLSFLPVTLVLVHHSLTIRPRDKRTLTHWLTRLNFLPSKLCPLSLSPSLSLRSTASSWPEPCPPDYTVFFNWDQRSIAFTEMKSTFVQSILIVTVISTVVLLMVQQPSTVLAANLHKRSFASLGCLGVYDKSKFARLDRVCEECYQMFREPDIHAMCR